MNSEMSQELLRRGLIHQTRVSVSRSSIQKNFLKRGGGKNEKQRIRPGVS